jgi:hypothetical protein
VSPCNPVTIQCFVNEPLQLCLVQNCFSKQIFKSVLITLYTLGTLKIIVHDSFNVLPIGGHQWYGQSAVCRLRTRANFSLGNTISKTNLLLLSVFLERGAVGLPM